MRARLLLSVLLSLVTVVALWGPLAPGAGAQSADPERPTLLGNREVASGTLTGSRGGEFHYYAIQYPGDGSVVTVEMDFSPADPVIRAAVGFNVYGADGFLIGAGQRPEGGAEGAKTLQYADRTAATWLIQVQNYAPGATINYTVQVKGLPGPPPAPTPGPLVTDSIVARLTGQARFSTLLRALDVADLTRLLQGQGAFTLFAPTNDAFAALPSRTLDGLLADPPRLRQLLLFHLAPGTLTAQDLRGVDVVDTLAAQALSVSVANGGLRVGGARVTAADQAAGNGVIHTVDAVLMPPADAAPASATLPGNRGGAFQRFSFPYPGDGQPVTVTLTARNFNNAAANAIGFSIFGPQGEVATASRIGASNRYAATVSTHVAGTYTVQVFNYSEGYSLDFSLAWE